jgi:hypothetical protein
VITAWPDPESKLIFGSFFTNKNYFMQEVSTLGKWRTFKDDPYENIKDHSKVFADLIKLQGHGIDPDTSAQNEVFAVLMDRASIDLLPDSTHIAALIGIHGKVLTVSLLSIEPGTKDIHHDHIENGVKGQQVWVDKKKISEMDAFLP